MLQISKLIIAHYVEEFVSTLNIDSMHCQLVRDDNLEAH